ncbi:MAG: FAD-dependent oxidoreductase, partial [Lachnospira sp.]
GLVVKPQMISKVSNQRPSPVSANKEEVLLESDLIIVAIGQGIESKYFEEHGINVKRGVIDALNTGNVKKADGIFAGGDCVTGPATVIKAIAAGKVAAANIDEYLGFHHKITCDVEIPYASYEDKVACGRVEVAMREAVDRKKDFEPIEYGFSCEEACQESGRCLRCDHFGFGAFRGGREEQW